MKLNNVLKIGLVLAGAMALGGSKAKATTYFEDFNNPQFSHGKSRHDSLICTNYGWD